MNLTRDTTEVYSRLIILLKIVSYTMYQAVPTKTMQAAVDTMIAEHENKEVHTEQKR